MLKKMKLFTEIVFKRMEISFAAGQTVKIK